ncbi:MAG: hypothetical protein IJT26_03315 [Bacteroidales bacterium]|nr:hypothetical protein [Bacteroidales bacterium]
MKKVGDILDDAKMKQRAFDLPVSYFEGLENRVSSKIGKQEGGGFVRILKPAALLACSLLFVFFIGYGILSLTGTSGQDIKEAALAGNSTVVEDVVDEEEEAIIEYLAQNISLEAIHEYINTSETDNDTSNQ